MADFSSTQPPPPQQRLIHLNNATKNEESEFIHNRISTTKYNLITFLPKFLYEQFSKAANVFFLFTALIQQIDGVSPTSRYTTAIPLAVVMLASALKEFIEDLKRYKSDDEVNNRMVKRLDGAHFNPTKWRDLKVGDLIRMENNESFPADLILLSSSEPDALCYIETSNLDGETNLKIRQGKPETSMMVSSQDALRLEGLIRSELPNSSLYTFEGVLELKDGRVVPLDPNQLLLRGAMLKNTRWIYAVVIFTGHETKLMRNATSAPIKVTSVERMANVQIGCLFLMIVAMALVSSIGSMIVLSRKGGLDYIYPRERDLVAAQQRVWLNFLTFIILYNNMIPISLMVTMEVVKLQQSFLINSDLEIYHEKTDTPSLARTSSLVEELGRVGYIFSDKTGTLTCNEMEFRQFTVAGVSYAEIAPDGKRAKTGEDGALSKHGIYEFQHLQHHLSPPTGSSSTLQERQVHASVLHEFLALLAVCHTVIPECADDLEEPGLSIRSLPLTNNFESNATATATLLTSQSTASKPTHKSRKNIVYQASSPDEGALVKGAAHLGFVFHTRRPRSVIIHAMEQDLEYEILNVCEFNSTRKRMSCLVRRPDGRIRLYTKGADTVILERLKRDEVNGMSVVNPYVDATLLNLEEYASEGLRTLCLAMRDISNEEYAEWNVLYEKAASTVNQRQDELDAVAELIERDLFLLGATAIEDKLQDDVPETIHVLHSAGIKLWVLTGDRQETAINIAYSCKLLTEEMSLLVLNEDTPEACAEFLTKKLRVINRIQPVSSNTTGANRNGGAPTFFYRSSRHNATWGSIFRNTMKRFSGGFRSLTDDFHKSLLSDAGPAGAHTVPSTVIFDGVSRTSGDGNDISMESIHPEHDDTEEEIVDSSQLDALALVVDGKTLSFALEPAMELQFLELATRCKAVVCCRVSPLQKALVVKLVKRNVDAVLLAIGDGANDVGMIQAAHVGVGISGMEGLQAARSSDFAISQFKFLRRLLLVHGSWSYQRLSKLILYCFYKNIALYMTQFWFSFYNGFSGQTLFESWTLSLYNVAFTLLQPLAIGVFEQFVSSRMLDLYPQMYQLGQSNEFFTTKVFWGYMANAIFQSLLLFFCVATWMCVDDFVTGTPAGMNGHVGGLWFIGTMLYTCILSTVTLKAALSVNYWTKYTWIAIPGSMLIWILFFPIYATIAPLLGVSTELRGLLGPLYGNYVFWFSWFFLVPVLCNLRDFAWKYYKRQYSTRAYHIIQEIQKYNIPDVRPHAERFRKAVHKVRMVQRSRRIRGYAFSQNESGQANLIRQYDTTLQKPSGI